MTYAVYLYPTRGEESYDDAKGNLLKRLRNHGFQDVRILDNQSGGIPGSYWAFATEFVGEKGKVLKKLEDNYPALLHPEG